MLVGAVTQRLIRGVVVVKPADDIAVNGLGGSVALGRVLDVVPEAAALVRRFDTPMRGRQSEVTQLRPVRAYGPLWRSMPGDNSGEAGIGKSRVTEEFVETLAADARVITGGCPAYGEGITFLPLREALLEAAEDGDIPALLEREGVAGADAGSILGAIGLRPQQGSPDGLFLAARRMFEALAAIRPLVVVFDDLHWAEPTLLDLIEFVGRSAAGPILLVVLARPELIEDHPEWAATDPRAQLLLLDPLPSEDIEALIEDRAGPTRPVGNVSKLAQTAHGNPLFAEQLLAALDEAEIEVIPAALRGLLAMRLDRLGPGERDILRCASVVGAESEIDAIEAIVPDEAAPFLDRHLGALERKQLIARPGTSIRFRHALIEFAAYQSIARETCPPARALRELAGGNSRASAGDRRDPRVPPGESGRKPARERCGRSTGARDKGGRAPRARVRAGARPGRHDRGGKPAHTGQGAAPE